MNAYEIPGQRFSLEAGAAVAQNRFVSVDSNGKAITATASTQIVGASMNEVTADEFAANTRIVDIATGIVMVEAGAAVTAGGAVYADANGKATGTAPQTGAIIAGVAFTAATAAGEIVSVKVN